jgi:predicted RNase H-like HicB family nuclease
MSSSVKLTNLIELLEQEERAMYAKMTMLYWKEEKFWLGKLLEHPEIMTQGETLEELEENIKDAYLLMAMDDVPEEHKVKEITI